MTVMPVTVAIRHQRYDPPCVPFVPQRDWSSSSLRSGRRPAGPLQNTRAFRSAAPRCGSSDGTRPRHRRARPPLAWPPFASDQIPHPRWWQRGKLASGLLGQPGQRAL